MKKKTIGVSSRFFCLCLCIFWPPLLHYRCSLVRSLRTFTLYSHWLKSNVYVCAHVHTGGTFVYTVVYTRAHDISFGVLPQRASS